MHCGKTLIPPLKPDKTLLISILYIKNTNKAVSIVVVSSLVFFIY
jgi:hypothetical protein